MLWPTLSPHSDLNIQLSLGLPCISQAIPNCPFPMPPTCLSYAFWLCPERNQYSAWAPPLPFMPTLGTSPREWLSIVCPLLYITPAGPLTQTLVFSRLVSDNNVLLLSLPWVLLSSPWLALNCQPDHLSLSNKILQWFLLPIELDVISFTWYTKLFMIWPLIFVSVQNWGVIFKNIFHHTREFNITTGITTAAEHFFSHCALCFTPII